jgi:serine/threonine-protein kinase ATR
MTKYHKKSPWGLISPHLSQVSPLLVSGMCTQPSMLSEACHFLSVTMPVFITATLHFTLPPLFANCDSKVLEQVANHASQKVSYLFLNRSHDILAHIFLLKGPGQTNKALSFILQLLRNAADTANIDIQSVIKSCMVPLLARLVVGMGDEVPEKAELVSDYKPLVSLANHSGVRPSMR